MRCSTALRPALWIGVAAIAASGCGSITGLDGTSEYACKAPPGVRCDSVTGTYHNAINNNLPAQRHSSGPAAAPPAPGGNSRPSAPPALPWRSAGMLPTVAPAVPSTGQRPGQFVPLRSAPRQLRLWIKPWEDGERDLNGESVVYVQVDNGRWLLDAAQRSVREPFAPGRGASATASSAPTRNRSGPAAAAGTRPGAAQGAPSPRADAVPPATSAAAAPAAELLPPQEDARRLQEALRALQPQPVQGPSN